MHLVYIPKLSPNASLLMMFVVYLKILKWNHCLHWNRIFHQLLLAKTVLSLLWSDKQEGYTIITSQNTWRFVFWYLQISDGSEFVGVQPSTWKNGAWKHGELALIKSLWQLQQQQPFGISLVLKPVYLLVRTVTLAMVFEIFFFTLTLAKFLSRSIHNYGDNPVLPSTYGARLCWSGGRRSGTRAVTEGLGGSRRGIKEKLIWFFSSYPNTINYRDKVGFFLIG